MSVVFLWNVIPSLKQNKTNQKNTKNERTTDRRRINNIFAFTIYKGKITIKANKQVARNKLKKMKLFKKEKYM